MLKPLLPKLSNRTIKSIRQYGMQTTGAKGNTVRVSVPRYIIEDHSKRIGITFEQFLEGYDVQWRYNDELLVIGIFVPKKS